MKLYRKPAFCLTDDEYIARLREQMSSWERWRFRLILLNISMIAVAIWILSNGIAIILRLMAAANVPFAKQGIVTGIMLGCVMGFSISGMVQNLMLLLFGLRSERLLLRYHEALNLEDSALKESSNGDSDFSDFYDSANEW